MVTLETKTVINAPIERCFDLARSVDVHVLGNVHWKERALAVGARTSGLIQQGESVTWRAKHFAMWHELTSCITALERPKYFRDVMSQGPFRSMEHDHHFRTLGNGSTEMLDLFTFAAPIPLVGLIAERAFLMQYMRTLLKERNEVIREVAEGDGWRSYIR